MSIRVLLVDDHRLLREALAGLLRAEKDFEIVGEVEDGRRAVELARDLRPDVVVMDLQMAQLNGIDATRQIVAEESATRVLALSAFSGRRWVMDALEAGAAGYVLKSDSYKELCRAVRTVHEGKRYLCTGVAGAVIEAGVSDAPRTSPAPALAPREREVVQLIAEGLSSKEIASRLHLSPHTIDTHRRNIMRKLDLRNVAELTRYAIREGLASEN